MFPTFLSRTAAVHGNVELPPLASELPRSGSHRAGVPLTTLHSPHISRRRMQTTVEKTTTLQDKHTPSAISSVAYISCVGCRPRVGVVLLFYGIELDSIVTSFEPGFVLDFQSLTYTKSISLCSQGALSRYSSPEERLVRHDMKSVRSQVTTRNYFSVELHATHQPTNAQPSTS
jgi:hypothetical protein